MQSQSFAECRNLKTVFIPNSVSVINERTFYHCDNLAAIVVDKSTPINLTTSYNAFYSVDKAICVLYVPIGSKAAYQAADQWKDFKNIVEGLPPVISTVAPTSIASTSALSGGNIATMGSSEATARGVCWSTSANPTITDNKTVDGTGVGMFSSSMTALTSAVTYHIRAYATNNVGTFYGEDISFNTLGTPPTVTTTVVNPITSNSVMIGGNVTSVGTSTVTARGVCWSVSPNPTILDSKTTDGTGAGKFLSSMTGLNTTITYHVRAYATNNVGTSYGDELSFTMQDFPAVSTVAASSITQTTASSEGNVTSEGASPVLARGICWSTTINPTIVDNKTTDGEGTGTFSSSITGLTSGIAYHIRAYATNSTGTSYGPDMTFTTLGTVPTLTTAVVSAITSSSAISGGNVTSVGSSPVTARGICWGTSVEPTIANSKTTDGTGVGEFISSISGLTFNKEYHYRAYATNSVGTSYGSDLTFTTLGTPIVTTAAVSSLTISSAVCGGSIVAEGQTTLSERGVCWSLSANPTINDNRTSDGVGTGAFSSTITGLTLGITYHLRAYATNSLGTSYGSDVIFNNLIVASEVTLNVPTAGTLSTLLINYDKTAITKLTLTGNIDARDVKYIRDVLTKLATLDISSVTIDTYTGTDGTAAGTTSTTYPVNEMPMSSFYNGTTGKITLKSIVLPNSIVTIGNGCFRACSGLATMVIPNSVETIKVNAFAWCSGISSVQIPNSVKTIELQAFYYCDNLTSVTIPASVTSLSGISFPNCAKLVAINVDTENTTYSSLDGVLFNKLKTTLMACPTAKAGRYIIPNSVTKLGEKSFWYCQKITEITIPITLTSIENSTFYNTTSLKSLFCLTPSVINLSSFTNVFYGYYQYSCSLYVPIGLKSAYQTASQWQDFTNIIEGFPPIVSTVIASSITSNSAISGGNVTEEGSSSITERGICWSTSSNPTIANNKTTDGTGAGVFSSSITGLTSAAIYHIRAYASNSVATAYGEDVTFTTLGVAPTVTTTAANPITTTTATSGGNVTNAGTSSVTARGVCWSTSANPTIADNKTTNGTGAGVFSSSITGLTSAVTYHIRAYATSAVGTAYGTDITFTTLGTAPTVTTTAASSITTTTATIGGNITNAGTSSVTARGVCWSTSANPTTSDSKTTDGAGIGAFSNSITGLNSAVTYHIRVYATSAVGTSYGADMTFTTLGTAPTVTTTAANSITTTSATSGGNVTNAGTSSVTARGVCWSTSANPTTSDSKTTDGAGIGAFSSSITDLTSAVTYHIRAYATSAVGTSYGADMTFTTLGTAPTITTTAASSITTTSAISGGNVTTGGTSSVTARGVCWSTLPNPTTADNKTTDGTGTGVFSSSLTGLTSAVTYHIRAYATSDVGTTYGSDLTFTTLGTAPTVMTAVASAITNISATVGGEVISLGTSPVTARGVCWSTSANPTTSDNKTTNSTGIGVFSSSITGLTSAVTYHIRAYATSAVGTSYGADMTFTTLGTAPTVTTTAASSITTTTATIGGNITNAGTSSVTARGVCWSTSANPTTSDNKTTDGTGVGVFSSSLNGLTSAVTYHIRAYATSDVGTAYGADMTFTTLGTAPTVTTTAASSITTTTATIGGNITNAGTSSVTARGVCWSTTANPTTSDNKTTNATGIGVFSSSITGLTSAVTYHIRAYATSAVGTSYGADMTFTTLGTAPTVTTTAASSNTNTSAISGGNVTNGGTSSVTARGVCWSTSANPTTADNKTTDGTGVGVFSSSIAGLSSAVTYHIRSYATSAVGTSYGSDMTFTTLGTAPTLTTTAVSSITNTSAISGGNVTNAGTSLVTARGICWSTSVNPTIADNKTTDGTGAGVFSSSITGLTSGLTYHIRAYTTSDVGTTYGIDMVFTTLGTAPTVTTTAASSITTTTVISGGNVTYLGTSSLTARGVCWSTSTNPTIADNKTTDGTGGGVFSSYLTGLTSGLTYHIRAYATSAVGTSYGADITFTTLVTAPTVTTTAASSITTTTAISGGNVTYAGMSSVTARGVCWSTSTNPSIADTKTIDGTGTGVFSSSIAGLNSAVTYHIRSYATSAVGTSYGSDMTFTTLGTAPTLTTTAVSSITNTSAISGGNVTNAGTSLVTARGICWSTSVNPTIADNKTTDGTGAGLFTSSITDLTSVVTYHIRSYATSAVGTSYGSDLTFTTLGTAPTVSTTAAISITNTSVISGGNVTNLGTSSVTARGICWSTSANPTIADSRTTDGIGAGVFSSSLTGLASGLTYHIRAYAISAVGASYGSDLTFTTLGIVPTITTTVASSITNISAISGGNVTNAGTSSVTARGVCWSTSANPTTTDNKTTDGTGTGVFSSSLTGLTSGLTYHIRAYAISAVGTSYGSDLTFTTLGIVPTITTTVASSITNISAISGGNVTNAGTSSVTARGVCWSTSANPTTTDNKTTDGTGTGVFSSSLTGLTSGLTYHIRAYATSDVGTSYGSDLTILTTTTGITDERMESITLYPNPVGNVLRVKGFEGSGSFSITDMSGRIIIDKRITSDELIRISSLPKGVYIVKIVTSSGITEKKVIKN